MDYSQPPLVCVTGGTGYIASSLIKTLLARGYQVRTTVRNPDDKAKTGFLWELPGATDRLQVLRADLLEEGSFDKVVQGVLVVFHIACPLLVNPHGASQVSMLDPALKGNMNVLQACAKSSSLKRVVMTSSCSTVRCDYNRSEADPPLNESCWTNDKYCREFKLWYALGKTLAEREAFKFAAEKNLNLVTINPSFVVGPFVTPAPRSSVSLILNLFNGPEYPNLRVGFVHIDDVVTAHVLAMEDLYASGRYICSSDVLHFSDVVNILKVKCPSLQVASRCSDRRGDNFPHQMDSSKLCTKLIFDRPKLVQEMFDDMLECFYVKGLIPSLY